MGPIFYKNIPKHVSIFQTFNKFRVLAMQTPPKIMKNRLIYILRKIPQNVYLFLQKLSLKWVGVLRLEWHTLVQTKSE